MDGWMEMLGWKNKIDNIKQEMDKIMKENKQFENRMLRKVTKMQATRLEVLERERER